MTSPPPAATEPAPAPTRRTDGGTDRGAPDADLDARPGEGTALGVVEHDDREHPVADVAGAPAADRTCAGSHDDAHAPVAGADRHPPGLSGFVDDHHDNGTDPAGAAASGPPEIARRRGYTRRAPPT